MLRPPSSSGHASSRTGTAPPGAPFRVSGLASRLDEAGPPSHRRPVTPAPSDDPAPPSRQGLAELLLLVGFLALAAGGAVAIFGAELRQAFGAPPPPATPPAAPARAP
jgi:hypothetical protein